MEIATVGLKCLSSVEPGKIAAEPLLQDFAVSKVKL
jgi:hypothetical protein